MSRLNQLLQLAEDNPEDSFILFAIAKEYEKEGHLKKAISRFEELKEKDPHYVGLYYHLGQLYEAVDQPEEALMTYQEGINTAKAQADFHALSELNNVKTNLEMEL